MLTSCATCSDWGRRSSRDATGDRRDGRCRCRRRPHSSVSARGAASCAVSRAPRFAAVLLRVGSRGSRLALTQAERAADALRGQRVGAATVEVALVPITTAGDRDRTSPFGEIGARGVFVKELEEALLEGRIDVAVHSAKDMTSSDRRGARRRGVHAARGSSRRALRRRRDPARECGSARHPRAAAPSCSPSSRRSRSSRCAATSTRGCASGASAASMPSCSPHVV